MFRTTQMLMRHPPQQKICLMNQKSSIHFTFLDTMLFGSGVGTISGFSYGYHKSNTILYTGIGTVCGLLYPLSIPTILLYKTSFINEQNNKSSID